MNKLFIGRKHKVNVILHINKDISMLRIGNIFHIMRYGGTIKVNEEMSSLVRRAIDMFIKIRKRENV